MKFTLTFTTTSDKAKRNEATARLLRTGGLPPNAVVPMSTPARISELPANPKNNPE